MIGRSKQELLAMSKTIWQIINSWISKCLWKVGRELMIKYDLQFISSYVMIIFIFPKTLIDVVEKMNTLWWGNGGATNKGIHMMSPD